MRHKTIYFFLSTITCLLLAVSTQAQHGLSYNQFGQLRNSFNGSLSTMDPDGGVTMLSRLQWIGMDGAPRSYWASGHVGIKSLGMTVGVDLKQGSLGPAREQEISGYAASSVRLSKDEYLSLSVGGGMLLFKGRFSDLDPNDPSFQQDVNHSRGMLSIGTSYFRENKFYFGISIPRFVLGKADVASEYEFRRVFYITGGALLPAGEGFHIRPSFIVAHMENGNPRYDVSALAFFAQQFGVGMGVQNQGDLSGLMQINIGSFGIGYSYQFHPRSSTMNQRISNNTHEIGLRYRVGGIKML